METRLLIRGEQVAGDGEQLAIENPATEETVASVGVPSAEQLDAAVVAANEAFPGWAATPAVERAELLHEVAIRLRARTDELARVMTLEGGKPLVENSDEVGWTASAFDYYAEMGRNFAGRVIPSIESTQLALVVKEPIGAWGCIVPVELPAAAARVEAGARDRGRQHRGGEAVGAHAAVDAHARLRASTTCRPAW